VAVQTSGTEGAEAKLDAITREQGEALREALRALGGRAPTPRDEAAGGAPRPPPLIQVGAMHLILRGLTDNRAGLFLAGLLGFIAQVAPDDDVSLFVRAWDLASGALSPIIGRGAVAIFVFVLAVASIFVIAGWVGSAVLNVVRFFGFTLREEDGVFSRSYGLLTKRVHTLPRGRIQAVRLRQTLLRRLFGLGEMRTDDMGASADDKSAEARGTDVFVPIARRADLEALLGRVLPAADLTRYAFRRTSPRIIRRSAARFALLGVVAAALAYQTLGPWALAAPAVFAALGAISGLLVFRTLHWAFDDAGLAVRRGVFRRLVAVVPANRIQALTLVATPFDRRHGVATLTAIVGGGARVAIPNVPVEEGREAVTRLLGLGSVGL
jgi:putative membrane protein